MTYALANSSQSMVVECGGGGRDGMEVNTYSIQHRKIS